MSRQARTDLDYQIDALAKGLKVFQALEGTNFEPVSVKRVEQRTGFSYDFCMRALRTLKIYGFAAQSPRGWTAGPKLLVFSERFNDLCLSAIPGSEFPKRETPESPASQTT